MNTCDHGSAPQFSANPVRMALSYDGSKTFFCCPVCRFEYVHLAGVEVQQGNLRTIITRNGCRSFGHEEKEFGPRGSIVRLSFWCENGGHLFTYSYRFHKGNTFIELHTGRGDDVESLPELWRN